MKKSLTLVNAEIKRGEDALKAARSLLREALFADSITRSYYAVFHAARACLLSHGQRPSSHKGVFMLFDQHLVRKGLIEEEYARILREEREERWLGDYAVEEEFDYERAKTRLEKAKKFVKRVKNYLRKL